MCISLLWSLFCQLSAVSSRLISLTTSQGFYGKCNGTRMAAISPLHVYNVLCPACSGDEAYDDSRFLLCYMGNLLKNGDAIIIVWKRWDAVTVRFVIATYAHVLCLVCVSWDGCVCPLVTHVGLPCAWLNSSKTEKQTHRQTRLTTLLHTTP